MNLYIMQEQANSMRAEYCLACHKIRSVAFWQVTPGIPIVLSVDDGTMARSVKIQEWCTCKETDARAEDTATRRSQGANDGWEIRRAKKERMEH